MKAKNFKQAIDALVILYKKGMRVKSMKQLEVLYLELGMCYAARNECGYYFSKQFYKYQPYGVGSYWFPTPSLLHCVDRVNLKDIKRQSIKPRLNILLKIQADLNKRK